MLTCRVVLCGWQAEEQVAGLQASLSEAQQSMEEQAANHQQQVGGHHHHHMPSTGLIGPFQRQVR